MNSQILDWESKYAMVVDENENLLLGMHNILEKLRNYDGEWGGHHKFYREGFILL